MSAWIITDSKHSPPFVYYHHNSEEISVNDFRKLIFGRERENQEWLFEYDVGDEPMCSICHIALSPTEVQLPWILDTGPACSVCTVD